MATTAALDTVTESGDDITTPCVSEQDYECAVCDKKYKTKGSLNRHILHHTDVKPEMCSECGKTFFTKTELSQHVATHGDRHVMCEICGKGYKSKAALYTHNLLKHQEGGVKCTVCLKRFADQYHLRRHIQVHTGSNLSQCQACGGLFRNLKDHERVCRGQDRPRQFRCGQCPAKFRDKRYLREHQKYKHTHTNRYSCSGCGETFAHRRLFLKHKHDCILFQQIAAEPKQHTNQQSDHE